MSDLVNGSSAQLVKYMRSSKLKFGFLSTYEWTIFIRRTGPCHFDMSLPIARDASNPSLRQCLLALGVLASRDWKFIEPPDFNIAQVSFRGSNSGNLLTSDPSSAFRRALHAKRPSVHFPEPNRYQGGDIGHAWLVVNPLRGRKRCCNNVRKLQEDYPAILREGDI